MTLETALTGVNDHLRGVLPPEIFDVLEADRRRAPKTEFAEVGSKVEDFELPGADGAPSSLGELVADGPAVLVFYRGQWCPYCNLTLRTYQQELRSARPWRRSARSGRTARCRWPTWSSRCFRTPAAPSRGGSG
jgi:hypothetical protein